VDILIFFIYPLYNIFYKVYLDVKCKFFFIFFIFKGIIKTALPDMSRENKEQYQVVIQAKDMGGQMGGLSGTTTVNITLTDVNNNPPRFPQSK
jgi:cadherin 15 (M-cadherin)